MTSTPYLIPVGETLGISWDKVKGSKSTIWAALAVVFAIMFGLGITDGILSVIAPKIEPVLNVFIQVFGFLLNMGIIYIGIRRAQDTPISYNLVFRVFDNWLWVKVIALYILQILILIIPMFLIFAAIFLSAMTQTTPIYALSFLIGIISVMSMIYLAVRIMLSMAFVLDKETNPADAIALSFRATQSNFWRLLWIFIVQSLILIVSAIPLGIGLIWTLPFSFINYGTIYKNLSINNLGS